ncbi:MAG: hypothetical protein LBD45_01195 [Bacteroidales bacterium]|nr:hypothetical protein [Bacteroidales bacterium]
MQQHTLTGKDTDSILLSSIRAIYEQSFPLDERRDFAEVLLIAQIEPAFCIHLLGNSTS